MERHPLMAVSTLCILLLTAAGCGSTPQRAPRPGAARVGELERLELRFGGVLLVKPDHHMASYDRLMVDPILITYKNRSQRPGAAEIERLALRLRDATARELVNVDPSKIVSEPGPCVLRMQTAFIDLELSPLSTASGSRASYVSSYGAVTLVHELRDSTSGTVLLRYISRRRAGGGSGSTHLSRWSGLVRTFDEMLAELRKSLVETVPLSTATEGPLAQCQGQIYRTIEAGQEGEAAP